MMNCDISIIIPSARPDRVGETIRSLEQQTISKKEYITYVVTPFGDELDRELFNFINVVKTDRLYPPGRMRNSGAASSSGAFLAFIDDDCVPPENWLREMIESLSLEQQVGAVGCRVVSGKKNFWKRCADYCLFGDYQGFKNRQGALGSAAILVRRQAFEEAGGFDDELLASEDWDFSLRLQKKGWKCNFICSVEVQHNHGRGSFSAIIKNSYRSGFRSGLIVQERNRTGVSWLASLSLSLRSPWTYWTLILPYAAAIAFLQLIMVVKNDKRTVLYFPVMITSRIAYHLGVWFRLISDCATDKSAT